jgi:hypothetical protein
VRVLVRSTSAFRLLVAFMSGRVTLQTEIARSATTGLLDEGIGQDHSMNWTYPQRVLLTHSEESEYQAFANAAD